MRKRVNSSEVPHLWFHKAQSEAYNSSKTYYFEGATIYSYGTHFPIAHHVTNKKGQAAVLFTIRTYSVSTSGHTNATSRAIPQGTRIFYVSLGGRRIGEPEEYLAQFRQRIEEAVDRASKPRIRQTTKDSCFGIVLDLTRQANEFAEFFGMRERLQLPESLEAMRDELDAARKRATAKAERDRKARIKREAAARVKYQQEHAEDLELWLDDERPHIYFEGWRWDTAFLRVSGGKYAPEEAKEVETSLGARIPFSHAKLGLRAVLKCRSTATPYQRNGHTIHLGHYAIDSIDAEGNLKAGCHRILWTEIERFANKYGLMPQGETNAEVTQ